MATGMRWRQRVGRWFIGFFVLLCLVQPACAASFDTYLSQIALINQMGNTYRNSSYKYYKANFSVRGCGPASVTNTLCTIFGITEQAEADQLLLEVMRLLAVGNMPAEWAISIDDMSLLVNADPVRYPLLAEKMAALQEPVETYTTRLTWDSFQEWVVGRDLSDGLLLMAMMRVGEQWEDVLAICDWLHQNQHGDALLLGYFLSTGTTEAKSPFGSDSGHFVSVCFQAANLAGQGAFYMIDSYEKALTQEEMEENPTLYRETYRIAIQGVTRFKENFNFRHLQPLVVRLSLTQERLRELLALRDDPEAFTRRRIELLSDMELYGLGGVMLYIPAKGSLP